jgi:16S rRNA (guanine966-N2)-methyltransferase
VDGGWLATPGVVVVERSARTREPTWPPGLARYDERRYGETRLWYAEHA